MKRLDRVITTPIELKGTSNERCTQGIGGNLSGLVFFFVAFVSDRHSSCDLPSTSFQFINPLYVVAYCVRKVLCETEVDLEVELLNC